MPANLTWSARAVSKTKNLDEKIAKLVEVAVSAAQWMTDANPGTDQHERGLELQKAIDDVIR